MMLRTTSGLSRPVLKWVSQVAASLGATLSATLIWSAVPHPGAAPGEPTAAQATAQPELTSGGKFAARAVHPVAYDGLDTMPLPHVAPPPARFVVASFDPAPPRATRRAAWDEPAAPERRAARPARAQFQGQARAEAHRAEPTAAAGSPAPAASTPVAPEPSDEGLLHRLLPVSLGASLPSIVPGIASTAREAWAVTASAGDALVARVAPRMP